VAKPSPLSAVANINEHTYLLIAALPSSPRPLLNEHAVIPEKFWTPTVQLLMS